MKTQVKTCSDCNEELTLLKSGKYFCRSCKKPIPSQEKEVVKPPLPPKVSHNKNTSPINKALDYIERNFSKPPEERPPEKVNPSGKTNPYSVILISTGLFVSLGTLFFYDPKICEYSSLLGIRHNCTYNIGLIGNKSNWITVGGFLFVGGCVLFNNRKD